MGLAFFALALALLSERTEAVEEMPIEEIDEVEINEVKID